MEMLQCSGHCSLVETVLPIHIYSTFFYNITFFKLQVALGGILVTAMST
jgi:hypothetical protein